MTASAWKDSGSGWLIDTDVFTSLDLSSLWVTSTAWFGFCATSVLHSVFPGRGESLAGVEMLSVSVSSLDSSRLNPDLE